MVKGQQIAQCQQMNRDELENIDNLFNIARMIGNYNKPLSDKEMLMDKYGVDIWG